MPAINDHELLLRIIDQHISAMKDELAAMRQASEDRHVEVMDLITGAFPDGDLKSHYQYHMRLIEEAQSRKAIRLEIWKKLLSGSIWSMLAYFGYQALQWIKDHVKLL